MKESKGNWNILQNHLGLLLGDMPPFSATEITSKRGDLCSYGGGRVDDLAAADGSNKKASVDG